MEGEIIGGRQGTKLLFDTVLKAVSESDYATLDKCADEFNEIPQNLTKCVDSVGNTIIHKALAESRLLTYLFKKYNAKEIIDQPNNLGKTPLHEAVRNNNKICAALLLEQGADSSLTNRIQSKVLHTAATCGSYECVELLLDRKVCDVNASDRNQVTALHKCAADGSVRVAELLVQKGANVNIQDMQGATPLHYAAQLGQCKVIEMLIREGANVDAETVKGITPLHEAASRCLPEVFQLLVSKGAVATKKTEDGNSALHLAALNFRTDDKKWADFIIDVVKAVGEEGLQATNAAGKKPMDYVHRVAQPLFRMDQVIRRDELKAKEQQELELAKLQQVERHKALLEERKRIQEEKDRMAKEEEERRKREDDERILQEDYARTRYEETLELRRQEEEANKKSGKKKKKDK